MTNQGGCSSEVGILNPILSYPLILIKISLSTQKLVDKLMKMKMSHDLVHVVISMLQTDTLILFISLNELTNHCIYPQTKKKSQINL